MVQTITKKQVEKAAKEFANQNLDKDWQEAVNIFKFMSDFLSKQKQSKIKFNENKCTITDNGVKVILTRKEYLLAKYLYDNANRIIPRDELLENIWVGLCVIDRTVDVHIRHLRVKLPSANIKTVKCFGYMWSEDEE
jgi:DNA-binding response OmpR family regulator